MNQNMNQRSAHDWLAYVPHAALLLVLGLLLLQLEPILLPFLLSAALAYMGDPLVDRLEARGLSRSLGVALVFLVLTVLAVVAAIIVVPMLVTQFEVLAERLPRMLSDLQNRLVPFVNGILGSNLQEIDANVLRQWVSEYWEQSRETVTQLLVSAGKSGGSALVWAANLLLVPVVTFYLLRDWDLIVERIRQLLPRKHEQTVVDLAQQANEVLGSFILGQLLVMSGLSIIYSLGLWVVGLEFPLLIGLLAGMVSFVPYLGAAVGIVVAGAAMWLQTGSLLDLVFVGMVFSLGQMIESMLLTPLLVGDKIGLHPVAVIFAVLAGGQLFGFMGILLALPVAAVVAVLLRFMVKQYLGSQWYGAPPEDATESDQTRQ